MIPYGLAMLFEAEDLALLDLIWVDVSGVVLNGH